MAHYSRRDYWDSRYAQRGGDPLEMHLPWSRMDADVIDAVRGAADVEDGRICIPGCGSSRLPEDLHDALRKTDEFRRRPVIAIDCVDWSATLCTALKERAAKDDTRRGGIVYTVGDARRMTAFGDGSFGAVVEKGLVDCLCCGTDPDASAEAVSSAIAEFYRILAPGGTFVHVTHSSKTDGLRSAVFDNAAARWSEVAMVALGGDDEGGVGGDDGATANAATDPASKGVFLFVFRK
jgi:SAM-dependent methyltransferase